MNVGGTRLGKNSEAAMINDAVMLKVGQWTPRGGIIVDGRHAVLEMKEARFGSWREIEWPGYYVRYAVSSAIERGSLVGFSVIKEKKHYLAKREYLWDFRILNAELVDLMLPDAERYYELIAQNGGIGIAIFFAIYEMDITGEFRKWHQDLGGKKTEYVRDRIARGSPPRTRKTQFMVTHSLTIFLSLADIEEGLEEGWISLYAQNMRNAYGNLRNPKYMLHLDHMPFEKLVCTRCFNSDPDEFAEVFGDIQPC